jgi:hypothetical protein
MHLDVDDGASVFLVTSGPSAPLALNGKIVSHDGDTVTIRIEDPTEREPSDREYDNFEQMGDRREVERYPTWLDATVFAPGLIEGQPAVITDLSSIGAAVEIDSWHEDAFFRLEFDVHNQVVQLECETVQRENTWRGTLLHVRFVLVTDEQRETIEALVAALRSVFGEAQEHLANDRLAPAFR